MGEELGSGARIAITMVILVSVVSILMSIVTMSLNISGQYNTALNDKINPTYERDIADMALLAEPIPVPSIYLVLSRYGVDNLAQFDMSIGGIVGTDADQLTKHFGKQLYVKLIEAPDGLHVWVGDYY